MCMGREVADTGKSVKEVRLLLFVAWVFDFIPRLCGGVCKVIDTPV